MDDKIKKIEEHKRAIEAIERQIEEERRNKLGKLHEQVGYDSIHDLIIALKQVAGGAKKGRSGISSEIKKKIQAELKAGGKGASIARKYGVSVPTVHSIKQKMGLVKARKK